MPTFQDSQGVRWSVSRRWWPFRFGLLRGPTMTGDGMYGLVQLVIAVPFLLVWPGWLLTRLFGAPWTIVVGRAGRQVHAERVGGWAASGRRITEIVASVQGGGGVSLPGPVGDAG
jgi:hypothetical protein